MTSINNELITVDQLNNFSDAMLFERYEFLTKTIEKRRNVTTLLEIELCYVQREIQLREERQYYHNEYLYLNEYEYENESQYPMLDDSANYEFVVLHNLWKNNS